MRRIARLSGVLASGCLCAFALNPSLDVSQYAHTAWTARDGLFKGYIFSVAQTPDGYLWLGTEFGLFRFDGVNSVAMQPPAGPEIREKSIFRLLGARDGTLWIGTFEGLIAWSGGKVRRIPELEGRVVGSLIEGRNGTIWAGTWKDASPLARLCAIRGGTAHCYGEDGVFGSRVSSLYEDGAGNLWAGADSGIFRWKPGPSKRYAIPPSEITGLTEAGDGRLIAAAYNAGLMRLSRDRVEPLPVRGSSGSNIPLRDHEIKANKLLSDRNGGMWIGTVDRGLIHSHGGRTDFFTRADGLSGDVILSLFEDREGNIWVSSTAGLDRFREFPVTTISTRQGLSSDATGAVLAAADGSIWVGAQGLTRWHDGRTTIFRTPSELSAGRIQSLFQDRRGRIWVSTARGLFLFREGTFVRLNAVPGGEAYCITEDMAGDLWVSTPPGLVRLREGRFVDQIPWSALGRGQQAKVVLADPVTGGIWLGFWQNGGVLYVKDGQLRASYTAADGLGSGPIADLRLDGDGALWVATQEGGLSLLKNSRITTLTTRSGLPCDTIHWTMDDENGWFWLYTGCGLVRLGRTELDAWNADPNVTIKTTVWDAADGVKLRAVAASEYAPRVAMASDGKLWFLSGEGVQVVDTRRLAVNGITPPVHIENVQVNGKPYQLAEGMRLPANVRDLSIDYTALSLAAPEKVRFKYMLEGQDPDWKEVINHRRVQYSNLRPRTYRFRVIAANNSGVWNETGDSLEFSVAPAFSQTPWFAALCAAALAAILWGVHRVRLHQLALALNARIEERARIARDLHDTLLQSFQGVMFSFQAARNMLPTRTEDAIDTIERAIGEGDQAIAEGRNAIQALRANPSDETSLEHLLTAAGKELTLASEAAKAPAFLVTVEGARQPLSPLLQDDVYMIAREILRNAFHHAQATRIEAEIAYDRHFFRLRIRDNGKGIDCGILERGARQGHWGLPGVQERAKDIGARLKLWSELGAGTEAELTVPARLAYRTGKRRANAAVK